MFSTCSLLRAFGMVKPTAASLWALWTQLCLPRSPGYNVRESRPLLATRGTVPGLFQWLLPTALSGKEPPGASVYSFLPGCDARPGSKDRSFESPLKMAPSSHCLAGEKGLVNTGRKQPPASQRRDLIRTQPCGNLIWDLQNKDNKFLLFKPFGLWHLVLASKQTKTTGK
ncbi:uncharacterized protein LOC121045103 isoform X2 [Herpailurus yagouaroundi]|uniref:uncharacterized protein LOC121045103 isoform X2 n=1 Tax=Herpailurus yagouaroundi TaxID=1608482 RepID=UPI001AD66872|nr:uncharacterized protein LOC121045103 isoform X2 [Puma yagouaroundi]